MAVGSVSESDELSSFEEEQIWVDPTEATWNTKFQSLLEKYQQILSKRAGIGDPEFYPLLVQLSNHAKDFKSLSESFGRIIISELYLPENQKTIKPVPGLGTAGGSKYICQGILFKLTLDVPVRDRWLYGGKARNDEKAMKSACHELKGLASLFQCNIKELRFPLMVAIHFHGFCMIAVSLLPLAELIYGSADGGATLFCRPPFDGFMEKAGKLLGLASHTVGGQRIFGPGDFEGHRGKDGNFYCLDFARLLPPESPSPLRSGNPVFYDLLRAKLVHSWPEPLCSDAFSGWMRDELFATQMNQEVQKVTAHLYSDIIPKFCESLSSKDPNQVANSLVDQMHKAGINCRHLGFMREHIEKLQAASDTGNRDFKYNPISRLLLSEAIARATKNLLRQKMRDEISMKHSDSTLLEKVHSFLQPIFFLSNYPQYLGILEDSGFLIKPPASGSNVVHSESTSQIQTLKARPTLLTIPALPENLKSFFIEVQVERMEKDSFLYFALAPRGGLTSVGANLPWFEGCSYLFTERAYQYQKWFFCDTCWPRKDGIGCCLSCSQSCHQGHVLRENPPSRFFCDCGASGNCKNMDLKIQEGFCCSLMDHHKKGLKVQEVGETVGIFLDRQKSKFLFTKENQTLGAFQQTEERDLVPFIVVAGSVKFSYNIGPHQVTEEKIAFPLRRFCKGFCLPFPKVPSLNLVIASLNWWSGATFKAEINDRFPSCLTPSELRQGFDLRQKVDILAVRNRFLPMSGVSLINPSQMKLRMNDIKLVSRTSDMCFLDEITAVAKLIDALRSKNLVSSQEFIDFLNSAHDFLAKVIANSVVHHPHHYELLARIAFEKGLVNTSPEKKNQHLQEGLSQLELANKTLSSVYDNAEVWVENIRMLEGSIFSELDRINQPNQHRSFPHFVKMWNDNPDDLFYFEESFTRLQNSNSLNEIQSLFFRIKLLRKSFRSFSESNQKFARTKKKIEKRYFFALLKCLQFDFKEASIIKSLIKQFEYFLVQDAEFFKIYKEQISNILVLFQSNGVDILNGFMVASRSGSLQMTKLIASLPEITLSHKQEGFKIACENGFSELVDFFLSSTPIDPSFDDNYCILEASQNGHAEVVKSLLLTKKVTPSTKNNSVFVYAAERGHLEILQLLLSFPGVDPTSQNNRAICFSCRKGHIEVVKFLFTLSDVDPSVKQNEPLRSAAKNGYIDIVRLLLEKPEVDPNAMKNEAIIKACENNHVELVELLIPYVNFQKIAVYKSLLIIAAEYGHLELFKILKKWCGPLSTPVAATQRALEGGHLEIIKLFEVAELNHSFYITLACTKGHLNVVQYILSQHEDLIPDNDAFCFACRNGYKEIVELLIQKYPNDIDCGSNDNFAIQQASRNGHLSIVGILLKTHKNLSPSSLHLSLVCALTNGHINVAKLLLTEPGLEFKKPEVLELAAKLGNLELVKTILDYPGYNPPPEHIRDALAKANFGGFIEIWRILISHKNSQGEIGDNMESTFLVACHTGSDILHAVLGFEVFSSRFVHRDCLNIAAQAGNYEVVKLLLSITKWVPSAKDDACLSAIEAGAIDILKLLLTEEHVDPSFRDNLPFKIGVDHGHHKIVQLLYEYPSVRSLIDRKVIIKNAVEKGKTDILKFFLNLEDLTQADLNDQLLTLASKSENFVILKLLLESKWKHFHVGDLLELLCESGMVDLVRLILDYPGVDISERQCLGFRRAAEGGHLGILELLIGKGINAKSFDNYAIKKASANGHVDIVSFLLSIEGVDPTAEDNYALRRAAENGHYDVVKMLLKCRNVDPTSVGNYAITMACQKGHNDVVKLLLKCKGVDPTENDNYALQIAAGDGNLELVRLLLDNFETDIEGALERAEKKEQIAVAEFLKQRMAKK